MRSLRPWMVLLLVALLLLGGCAPGGDEFSGSRAMSHVRRMVRMGSRAPGTEGNAEAAQYITNQVERYDWKVERDCFAYGGETLCNLIAKKGQGPIVLVGAHYDTRPLADRDLVDRTQPVPGANDGASGTAVLLELARTLDTSNLEGSQIWLVFFDGEDSGEIAGWEWGAGASHLAQRLTKEPQNRVQYVIVADMIGDADQQIYYEWSSTLWLKEELWRLADSLGYGDTFLASHKHHIIDDHTPFLQVGIPAVLLIDFDYPYWHTLDDTPDKLDAESLQRVGDVIKSWLEDEPLAARAIAR
ncbi:MAG: M28 family peptidase [Anaerolineae bacterium]|jgi:glutaminyl-peptide cyclotransferase|nr:M28 family peptidase [Chloroflexota bacterium]